MNLLKIFTYGGIIEVFVVPHILPCVMGFVPSHINDMIQLAISLISSLFPHISINVQSEVFLKVWKDPGGDDQPLDGPPGAPDFKSDTASSSDGSSPSSGSPHLPAPYSKSTDCRPCGSGPAPSHDRNAKSTTRGPASGCPDVCHQRLVNRLADDVPAKASNPRQIAFVDQSATTSSLLSERSDLFARSCSAEYQVKPANSEELVDLRGASLGAYASGASCAGGAEPLVERLHPSFAKSCSLEYATVVRTPRADCANDAELVGASVAELESRWTSSEVRNLAANDGKAALDSKRKSAVKFAQSPQKLPAKKAALVAPAEEVKPVYFGDNFQNL